MKKEDLQSFQAGTVGFENKGQSSQQQKNPRTTNSDDQEEDKALQAGLGRDRITGIEDLGGTSGRDYYAGSDEEDIRNENTDRPSEKH